MTFLAPAMLAGLGVVAAPVAIHFLNKMRVQVVRWGATQFLLESLKKNQRRLQIEDLILLLLRCLLIALLALAFARPVINPGSSEASNTGSPSIVVFLLDQSASMGQSNGVETRLDQAKTAARKSLDQMGHGSQAALFLVTDRVTQVIARPTANLALVRHALEAAVPTDRTSDMLPAMRAALDALRPFSGTEKKIVVLTDRQAVAWQQMSEIQSLLGDSPDVQLQIDAPDLAGEDNLAIVSMKPENLMSAAGQLFGCYVEVHNFGTTPAAKVRVTLSLNGDVPADEAVINEVAPAQSQVVRLNARFAQAGFQTLRAAIPPDRLPADNERALAVQVIDQIRTAIVEGGTNAPKLERDAFFLSNALAPVSVSRRADYYLKSQAVAPSWLETADLVQNEIIFLVNVGHPTATACKRLREYVNDGGSLVIFPGPNVQPDDYNNEPTLEEMLPGKWGALRDLVKNGEFASWQTGNYPHPITALWNDAANGSFATVRATKYFPLNPILPDSKNPDQKNAPRVVVSYTDGTPAVMERAFGKGHVVMFSSTATPQWNTLPIHPNFVPFLQRLTGYLSNRQSPGSLTLAPGSVFQQEVEASLAGREFSVIPPDGKGQSRPGGRIELVGREALVRYANTEKAGAYRLFITGSDVPFAAFAVQMDPKESDLKNIAGNALNTIERPVRSHSNEKSGDGKVRREFWGLLVALAAVLAIVEMLLAHRFSLAK